MPRLISVDKKKEKKITHKDCGAVIGYYQNEVKEFVHHDYGGGSDLYHYIECPKCKERVFLD